MPELDSDMATDNESDAFEIGPDTPLQQHPLFEHYEYPYFLDSEGDSECGADYVDLHVRTLRGITEEIRGMRLICCGKDHENPHADRENFWECEIRHLLGNLVCGHPGVMMRKLCAAAQILRQLDRVSYEDEVRIMGTIRDVHEKLVKLDGEYRSAYRGTGASERQQEIKKEAQQKEQVVGETLLPIRDELLEHFDALLESAGGTPKEESGTTVGGLQWERTTDTLRPYRVRIDSLLVDMRLPDQADTVVDSLQETMHSIGRNSDNIFENDMHKVVLDLMSRDKYAFDKIDVKLSAA